MSYPTYARPGFMPAAQVSTWWRRVGAYAVDSAILAIPLTALTMVRMFSELSAMGESYLDPVTGEPNIAVIQEVTGRLLPWSLAIGFAASLLFTAYIVIMHATLGQTLGKMAVGIKVVKEDGSRCDLHAAAKRAVIYPLAAAIPMFGGIIMLVNGLSPHWDPNGRSIGDKFGGTYVVKK